MPRGDKTGLGNWGGMDDNTILAKQERTHLVEDPNMLDYHQRSILKDKRPDAPAFPEDFAKRGGYDPRTGEMRQGASDSRAKLALRYIGKRSWVEPNLPDGSFLDWQGLEPDPRSIRPDPDMQNYAKQAAFRGRYVKFFPDADNSVPETGMNTYQRWQATRGAQNWTADRLKVFSTGKDNRTTRRAGQSIPKEHRKVQVTVDGEIVNLSDALTTNKSNLTGLLTNQYKVGWRRTTDQEFQVAKYGQVKSTMNMADQAWYKSLRQGQDDRVEMGVFQDQRVPKLLVQVMENIIRGRAIKQKLTGEIPWRSSYGLKNYKDPMVEANYTGGNPGNLSIEDRATEVVRLLQDSYVRRKDSMLAMPNQPDSHLGFSWVDPSIVQFMELSTRKIGPLDVKMILKDAAKLSNDLGYKISDQEMKVYVPSMPSDYKPVEASWKSTDPRNKDESLVAQNYLNIDPKMEMPLMGLINQEDYKSRVDSSLSYSQAPPPGMPNSLVGGWLSQSQDFALDRDQRGSVGGIMGGKFLRRNIVPTHMQNIENLENMDVNDSGGMNRKR